VGSNPVRKLFSTSTNYSLLNLLPSSFPARNARDYSSEIGELSIGSLLEKASIFKIIVLYLEPYHHMF